MLKGKHTGTHIIKYTYTHTHIHFSGITWGQGPASPLLWFSMGPKLFLFLGYKLRMVGILTSTAKDHRGLVVCVPGELSRIRKTPTAAGATESAFYQTDYVPGLREAPRRQQ